MTIVVKLNLIGLQCDRPFIKSDHRNFDFVRFDHIERLINSYGIHQYEAAQVHYRGTQEEPPYKIHPGRIALRPTAATSNFTEEQ